MLILGLLLVLAGIVAILAVLFGGTDANDTVEVLGNDLTAATVFLVGLAAGVAILLGLSVIKLGTKRTLQRRRERQRLAELSQKLDEVEAGRTDEDRDRDTRI